jgi:hypothetical protein
MGPGCLHMAEAVPAEFAPISSEQKFRLVASTFNQRKARRVDSTGGERMKFPSLPLLSTLFSLTGRAEFDSPPGSGRNLSHPSPSPLPSPSSCHYESFSLQKKYNPAHSITRMHQDPNIEKTSVFPTTVAQSHIQTSPQVRYRGRAAVASLPPSRPAPGQTHNNMQLCTVALNAIRQTLCTQPETRVRDITFPASLRGLRYFIRCGEYSDDQPPGRASTI